MISLTKKLIETNRMTKKLIETGTNLDKKSIHLSDNRSSCQKRYKSLFCCKTPRIA